ncbi:sensor histidine kinase [Sphingomonas fennica]|uniref:histidine kinase n=1 Tax=Edaphosphingomonas fennica TaxID=114404 RepID=A0A2T4HJ53_9SPHN|nr:PAS domain-containing sensor histidine kinase [Sphingomonas fennica]PTD15824.1 PAS domain-containing sensor histidine kinase [Sphingomonas fennica]
MSVAPSRSEGSAWLRRLTLLSRRRLMPAFEIGAFAATIAIAAATYFIITGGGTPARLLTPPLVALLLVANLVPIMVLLVLLARRVARGRAARSPVGGNGRLHVRLVALFSVIASVPTLLVVIFASLLFQYGVEFWFSDRARTVLENADSVAQAYVEENKQRIVADIVAMGGDVNGYAAEFGVNSPRFAEGLAWQVSARNLSEAAVITIGGDGTRRLIAGANLDDRPLELRLPAASIAELRQGRARVVTDAGDRVETVVRLDPEAEVYLYASRGVDPMVLQSVARAKSARGDYAQLLARSRSLQLQFNAALLVVSLLIVATAILIALKMADRIVRPVADLVGAARQVASGNLSARVALPRSHDEIGTLAAAFNRMTRKLEEQTGALLTANQQLDSRRALIEAVLSGVSAGVISVDSDGIIRLINPSAAELLKTNESPVGRSITEVAPELGALLDATDREAVIQFSSAGEPRTLAVTLVRTGNGEVLTFDDITQQLLDQRRAAWSDVARRIAHEIKNPLTPIQLAAERLQRRYGQEVQSDKGVFERLTGTIVRQVGDLRRMVDEFSSFARMPKPIFRAESLVDIARQALFLHEVAHPAIAFRLVAPDPSPIMVCDRRQLGQALTNIVKNAVEAIDAKGEGSPGSIDMTVAMEGERLLIMVADDGIGLPPERERITEPYMTTRARGTGLGLAIVRKIVEEHFGTIVFSDRPGGGTIVTLGFDVATLASLDLEQDADATDDAAPLPVLTRQKSDG